ncbi:thiamine diphosphokinase [Mucilaginibacter sp. SMC90]|uniref:thiamine diphosphokinase n=1 Tax=Mucilaginibacter sp. SMC90 TaxID=2929803 RepID=UPI001FB3762A|nr:thiamine diphosphokinase [Mucilaginibacter sp. SMC90]UOE49903.1 thiamine diphosphokinase [Mucilaginibacter sp. SMC90]
MSSHHIVREKQEPALLVLSMDTFDEEMLGQLLEWSPTVICTTNTAEKLDASGIKVDWIIGDGEAGDLQSDVKHMPLGEDNAAGAALKYLVTHNYPAVNVITDVLELKDFLFYADKINLVIFREQQKIYAVNPGFSKWKPACEFIELLSHSPGLQLSGLEAMGNNRYKTTHDGFFTLQFEQPFLFIAEDIE